MFLVVVSVLVFCVFVSPSRIMENYSTDFLKIRWKGGETWATEETVIFWWQFWLRYVTVRIGMGLRLRLGGGN